MRKKSLNYGQFHRSALRIKQNNNGRMGTLGRVLGVLGRIVGVLGRVVGALGCILGPLGHDLLNVPKRSQNAPKLGRACAHLCALGRA